MDLEDGKDAYIKFELPEYTVEKLIDAIETKQEELKEEKNNIPDIAALKESEYDLQFSELIKLKDELNTILLNYRNKRAAYRERRKKFFKAVRKNKDIGTYGAKQLLKVLEGKK